jgi:hypothetical protein
VIQLHNKKINFFELQFDDEPGTVRLFIFKQSKFKLLLSVYEHKESACGGMLFKDENEKAGIKFIPTPLEEYEHLLSFECTLPQLAQALHKSLEDFLTTKKENNQWWGWGMSFSKRKLRTLQKIGQIHLP